MIPATTPPSGATTLSGQNLMYPRVIRLAHSGSANGTLVADATAFPGGGPVGAVFASTSGPNGFTQIGQVADSVAQSTGLCCTTLFELPRQIGSLPAGTLLWAGSVGQNDSANRRMAIRLWASSDQGRTWRYQSTAATSANNGGFWEPDLFIDGAGQLGVVFSDESQAGQSQELVEATSADAVSWTARRAIVTGPAGNDRPGMGTVQPLASGGFLMSYEICGQAPSQYDCGVYTRSSSDAVNWGSPTSLGTLAKATNGNYFANAPMIAQTPQGSLVLVAQNLRDANGSTDGASGRTLFVSGDGASTWTTAAAPVALGVPNAGPCDNYSSALLPSTDGASVLEIATNDAGSGCTAWVASGPLPGAPGGGGTTGGTTGGGGSGSACHAQFQVGSSWAGGYTATVTVTSTAALSSWTVGLTLAPGDTITNLWNGVDQGTSGAITVGSESYNGSVPAGGNLSFGYQATSTHNPLAVPTGWTLNGTAC